MKDDIEITKNSVIKSEIDLSFHKIRKHVASWLIESKDQSEVKEDDFKDDKDVIEKARPRRLGLGANVKEIEQTYQFSKANILLKKLTSGKKRKQEDNKEMPSTLEEDDSDLDSKSTYVKRLFICNRSNDDNYNDQKKILSSFDIKVLTNQTDSYSKSLHYQVFHELIPEIVPTLRGSIEYNFKEKTAIYYPQNSLYEFKTIGNHIKTGFYRVGVFNSEKKFKNGFIQWSQLRNLLEENTPIHEEIILYMDAYNNVWHVDYVLNILDKKKNKPQKVITTVKVIFPTYENGVMPIFNKPVALSPDGKPLQNQKKNFFQKYWMYIVPFILFLLVGSRNAEGE
ncbi:hypothetical protein PCANB_002989 [Pneumocystis canis]|nr:hypothetical protein PCK1_003001 [Pneumocystis canis]KAG5438138.1 hypothetical protein PCANB_002989 [Pneumocystis canis]